MKISSIITLLFAIPVAVFFAYEILKPKDFSDADITNIKADIKTEFGKRDGVAVTEVVMMREAPRKLMGYAKLHFSAPTEAQAGYASKPTSSKL